jgi:two-component system response regulator PilR (NtrC family)
MPHSARIIVVDDDESIRTVLKVNLEDKGYIVDTAKNGRRAIKKIEEKFYNLALIDIRLPDIEGIEVLEKFGERYPKMIKIIVTGFPSLENAIEAVNKGADGYILKPVNMEDLLKVVEEKLERQQRETEYSEEKVTEYIETRARELKSQMKFYAPI